MGYSAFTRRQTRLAFNKVRRTFCHVSRAFVVARRNESVVARKSAEFLSVFFAFSEKNGNYVIEFRRFSERVCKSDYVVRSRRGAGIRNEKVLTDRKRSEDVYVPAESVRSVGND